MMWIRLLFTLAFLCMLTPGFAQSADQHVLGTIMAIDKTHVEIRTTKGQSVIVRVDNKTRYKDESGSKGMNMPEVLVVDDGSRDGTGEVARRAGAEVLSHPHNRGKGAALRTALTQLASNSQAG